MQATPQRVRDTAGIVVIGDEILSGKTREENASFLVAELRDLGVALRAIAVIPDVVEEIAVTVRAFAGRFEHVFTSGGVGPTHDDLTMEGVARAFETRVVRHPRLEALLRAHYGDRIEERNLRMADVPANATLVDGESLAWPIPCCDNVYVLPGIPEVFRRKFGAIRERFRSAPFHLASVFVSADEGVIAGALDAVAGAHPAVAIGSYPRIVDEGWRVRVTIEAKDADQVEHATAALLARLGAYVAAVERPSASVAATLPEGA